MHEFVSFNHKVNAGQIPSVAAISCSTLYGKGIFTTLAIYDERPILWGKHWRRLTDNAEKLKIDLAEFSESETRQALDEIIQRNNVVNGRTRITFFDDSPSATWPFEIGLKTSLLIMTGNLRAVPENFRLTVSPYRTNSQSSLAGVKSCNYLEKLMTLDEAKTRGFDEAIMLNERDEVTSGAMANVFWLKDDVLFTPSLKTGCLPGTTREFVMENLDCHEVEVTLDEMYLADAIFLTSAGLGLAQVNEFEGKILLGTSNEIERLKAETRL